MVIVIAIRKTLDLREELSKLCTKLNIPKLYIPGFEEGLAIFDEDEYEIDHLTDEYDF